MEETFETGRTTQHNTLLMHLKQLKQLPLLLFEQLGGTLKVLGGTVGTLKVAPAARASYISRCNSSAATLLGVPQRQQLP